SRRRHTRSKRDWSSDVCSSDLQVLGDQRPRVLYAPTWRADNDEDVVDTDRLIDDLKALAGLDIQLMYRGHHRMNRLIKDSSVSEIGRASCREREDMWVGAGGGE